MPYSKNPSKIEKTERRKHWSDRREMPDRRNQQRLNHMEEDCRNHVPRRQSDITGSSEEGELWWSGDRRFV